jgi:hypothetical protein
MSDAPAESLQSREEDRTSEDNSADVLQSIPKAQASDDAAADAAQNLPGAVPEVLAPDVALPPLALPESSPSAQISTPVPSSHVSIPLHSPRSVFVPPDVETAKRHASENRPMMRDQLSGLISPYVTTMPILLRSNVRV